MFLDSSRTLPDTKEGLGNPDMSGILLDSPTLLLSWPTRARPLSPIRTRQPARRPLTRPLLHPSIICAAPEFFLHESTAVPEPSPAPGDGANIAFARRTSTPGMCGMCISLSECSSLAPVPLRAIHAWSGLLQNSAGERSHERCISRTRGLRKLRPPLQPVERVVKSLARAH